MLRQLDHMAYSKRATETTAVQELPSM